MKKILLSVAIIGMAAFAITGKSKSNDPVVMTVGNQDVKLSEFEYLYNKNNNQQLTPLTFDEYIDMFVNYKLKVADALDAKLDTTSSFRSEFEKFRRELAQPYLRDTVLAEQLVQEAYDHTSEDVYVSHIMLSLQQPDAKEVLDSLRNEIVSGAVTFEDVARQYSVDRGSAPSGGHMGWVAGAGPYPWAFEKAAYDTPVGEISEPINSGAGYHLIRPDQRRPSRGEVQVEHILLLTRGMDDEAAANVKARIDSVYQVVTTPGANFNDVAMRLSQDPGSARRGGLLDWFGAGRMVAEFDSVAFAIPDGAISEPFKTAYGYHIIHKLAHRGNPSLEEMRPTIEAAIENDSRAQMPVKSNIDKAAATTGSKIYPEYRKAVLDAVAANNGECDSVLVAMLKASDVPVFIAEGKTSTLGGILKSFNPRPGMDANALASYIDRLVNNAFDSKMVDYQIRQLELNEPAYSNLVNEYRDGILLFDRSNQKVWEKATKDIEGLNKQFADNKEKYSTWTSPKFKSYVIFANNDSILDKVMEYVNANYGKQKITEINQEAFVADVKDKYGRGVKVERVIAAKGDNPITDYLAFGGEKPAPKGQNWTSYAAFAQEIIDQPEEVNDVKGAVVADYQSELEQQWLKELHNKYKVKINKKELKKANK